jgi:hypothetical protein
VLPASDCPGRSLENPCEVGLIEIDSRARALQSLSKVRQYVPLLSSEVSPILSDDMDDALKTVPPFLRDASYLPRVTRHDGRALEEALAGSTLFDRGARLRGGVIEATYAASDPPILRRLRDGTVPLLVEPQTLRFTGEAFLETESFSALPYRPREIITPGTLASVDVAALARGVLEFQQEKGCAAFIAPALPLYDRDRQAWMAANQRLLQSACDANGSGDIEARPMLAQIAPGRKASEDPGQLIQSVMDLPVDGVYVQPLLLNPARDSVEKLVRYVQMLEAFETAGLPVVAARVGAFGVLLTALGISASNLASLNRKRSERPRSKEGPKGTRRLYLGPLKTTMAAHQAELILGTPGLKGRFACNLGCCRFQSLDELPQRARHHYLWARNEEVRAIRDLGTPSMKLDLIHEELRNAREVSRLVRRTLIKELRAVPSFEHIDRWIRVLAREVESRAVA